MLPSSPSFERTAVNRVSFGARERDIESAARLGWKAWVEDQLAPPAGDDADLAAALSSATMRIKYNGQPQTKGIAGWPDVDQYRPLQSLTMEVAALWDMARKVEYSVAANELSRVQQELNAATWMRNTHATYQVREFMVDFWNNHFNIGRQADVYGAVSLPAYDSQVIRPRALGNFRDLLGAVATSPAMQRYLDNATSTAQHPNENYARELLELHTLGRSSYGGIAPATMQQGPEIAASFTDQDVIQAAHALSGWTLEQGQDGPNGVLPFTGKFAYNPLQHSPRAGNFLGVDLSALTNPMQQGNKVLDVAATHPATATFICTKLAQRIFGDTPPPAVIARAQQAWLKYRDDDRQIAHVLMAILTDGQEIGTFAPESAKIRRPYERLIAFFRTTDTLVAPFDLANSAVEALGDGIYAWPTPDGRPDRNAQWLTTSVNLYNWNLMLLILRLAAFTTTLAQQTPQTAAVSATTLVEYWVMRMVGYGLHQQAMSALVEDAAAPGGAMEAFASGGIMNKEVALRRLVALIGATPEFGLR